MMRQLATVCAIAAACGWAVVGTSCRKVIDEQQARAIADAALAQYAEQAHLKHSDFDLTQFDDSGKVVDWFFVFESNTRPTHVVSVLIDRYGGHEMHHGVDGAKTAAP
jgi:hypothetical protein